MTSMKLLLSAIRSAVLFFGLSALPVVFVVNTATAVTITPAQPGADILYDAAEDYTITNGGTTLFGITILNGTSVTLAQRGGSTGFVNTLSTAFGAGWNFFSAASDLTGSFNIDIYDAVGTPTRVGANFDMNYVTGTNDVVDFGGLRQFHWIQRVFDNHALAGGHGVNEDIIDTSVASVPFYDAFGPGETPFPTAPPRFQDGPFRSDADKAHQWLAEVYLVEELAKIGNNRQIRIYNGVNWGWENRILAVTTVPLPPAMLLFATGYAGLILLRRRRPGYRADGLAVDG